MNPREYMFDKIQDLQHVTHSASGMVAQYRKATNSVKNCQNESVIQYETTLYQAIYL